MKVGTTVSLSICTIDWERYNCYQTEAKGAVLTSL
jgi:hypothetical protein